MEKRISTKKQALQTRREEILKELKYYEKKIDEARNEARNTRFYEDDSSDSEQEFNLDISPSVVELKLQQSMLKTCLNATQELTSLQVLQSEVNVLVDNPVFEGEPPITEPGTWREVTVECRVDLVPFSMSFYTHQPNRLFAPISYRNLQITPVKSAHELELSKSVLSNVRTPSNAVEVIRSYARAHRSRRSSLARLAEKYGADLFMEPGPEGGYILKCANLLETSWLLQNKWSPIAPFHHKLKFDVEYMDEAHIKIIIQAHKQLSDPDLQTDERTLLIAKIINTCLEAKKLNPKEMDESMKDSELMAPPKTLPKKTKNKRHSDSVGGSAKKPKIDENKDGVGSAMDNKKDKFDKNEPKSSKKLKTDQNISTENSLTTDKKKIYKSGSKNDDKNNSNSKLDNSEIKKSNLVKKGLKEGDNGESAKKNKKNNNQSTKDLEIKVKKVKNIDRKKDTESKEVKNTEVRNNENEIETTQTEKTDDLKANINNKKSNNKSKENKILSKKSKAKTENIEKTNHSNKNFNTKTPDKNEESKKSKPSENNYENSEKNEQIDNKKPNKLKIKSKNDNDIPTKKLKTRKNNKKSIKKNDQNFDKIIDTEKETKNLTSKIVIRKVITTEKISDNLNEDSSRLKSKKEKKKNSNKIQQLVWNGNIKIDEIELKNSQLNTEKNIKVTNIKNPKTSKINDNTKNKENNSKENFKENINNSNKLPNLSERFKKSNKNSNFEKKNSGISKIINKHAKVSKIPQKRLSDLKKNPLRISPRKPRPLLSSSQDSSKTSVKSMQKVSTNIPRLIKKPSTKT